MKVSKAQSQKNHERMVGAASVAFRQHGISTASVADIANSAGLTHGALYRHFPDKDALAAAAITSDFGRIVELLKQLKDGGRPAADYVGTYLTEDHRDHFIWGCPAAPLASEIMRLGETVQAAFSQGFEGNVAGIADLIGTGDRSRDRQQALFMISAMVGAMALARATKITAPDLSGEILRAVSQCLSNEPVR